MMTVYSIIIWMVIYMSIYVLILILQRNMLRRIPRALTSLWRRPRQQFLGARRVSSHQPIAIPSFPGCRSLATGRYLLTDSKPPCKFLFSLTLLNKNRLLCSCSWGSMNKSFLRLHAHPQYRQVCTWVLHLGGYIRYVCRRWAGR